MSDARNEYEAAIAHDRDLAWELYEYDETHPQIPVLARSVIAREPSFTGMVVLMARHYRALDDFDQARDLLQGLIAQQDRQQLNALRDLRDLEGDAGNRDEALRLAEQVLRDDPEASWIDLMELGNAVFFVHGPEAGWKIFDDSVEMAAQTDPDRYPQALGQRALRLHATGAPVEKFVPAAEEAVRADPSETLLSASLGFAYLYDYRLDEADAIFRRMLRDDPTDVLGQTGVSMTGAYMRGLESGETTMEDLRQAGTGEIAWRLLRDQQFGTDLSSALDALDAVIPPDLAAALLPPLDREAARESRGNRHLLAWHNGQTPGTGQFWRWGQTFRLMTGEEVDSMEKSLEEEPELWPQWDTNNEYFELFATDDEGSYLFEGPAGRVFVRGPGEDGREIAESVNDWVWDRVASFGGRDRRPGRR